MHGSRFKWRGQPSPRPLRPSLTLKDVLALDRCSHGWRSQQAGGRGWAGAAVAGCGHCVADSWIRLQLGLPFPVLQTAPQLAILLADGSAPPEIGNFEDDVAKPLRTLVGRAYNSARHESALRPAGFLAASPVTQPDNSTDCRLSSAPLQSCGFLRTWRPLPSWRHTWRWMAWLRACHWRTWLTLECRRACAACARCWAAKAAGSWWIGSRRAAAHRCECRHECGCCGLPCGQRAAVRCMHLTSISKAACRCNANLGEVLAVWRSGCCVSCLPGTGSLQRTTCTSWEWTASSACASGTPFPRWPSSASRRAAWRVQLPSWCTPAKAGVGLHRGGGGTRASGAPLLACNPGSRPNTTILHFSTLHTPCSRLVKPRRGGGTDVHRAWQWCWGCVPVQPCVGAAVAAVHRHLHPRWVGSLLGCEGDHLLLRDPTDAAYNVLSCPPNRPLNTTCSWCGGRSTPAGCAAWAAGAPASGVPGARRLAGPGRGAAMRRQAGCTCTTCCHGSAGPEMCSACFCRCRRLFNQAFRLFALQTCWPLCQASTQRWPPHCASCKSGCSRGCQLSPTKTAGRCRLPFASAFCATARRPASSAASANQSR